MQAATTRHIKGGREYDYLFPAAMNKDKTVLQNATLEDTIAFIHKVVRNTLAQTNAIAPKLAGRSVYETCRNIWNFVYDNIAYQKDKEGLEQIRSPRRTWRDRRTGVDCDCYSTFISSILTNLGIPHKLRITKYKQDHFQHIYPIVPDGSGFIILDCVTDKFDYEVPYSEKKDITMDLQYLDGLQGAGTRGDDLVFDGYDEDMGDFGAGPKKKKKKRGFFKKLLSKINKINPVTLLLRNGFLAAMKLNLFKVASRIKYAYLSPEEAAKRGILPDKYDKLVKVLDKLESIFETAGGNPKNLKKAILKGKGNKNKEVAVSGLGFLDADMSVLYMDSNTPLAQLLGPEIYHSENVEGMEGFQGFGALGEPVTAAAVASASGAVAVIAKLLKNIGNIFGSKEKGSEDFAEEATAAADKEIAETPAAKKPASLPSESGANDNAPETAPAARNSAESFTADNTDPAPTNMALQAQTLPIAPGVISADKAPTPPEQESFWQKNKKWLLPTVIGVGGIAAIAIGMKIMKSKNHPPGSNLQGVPKRKNAAPKRKQHKKKTAVALL